MNKPDFFIVGVPKSGTTAMSEYLGENPSVFMSYPKEPHFFADDFPMYKENLPGLKDYLGLFKNVTPECQAVGEASVYYLYSNIASNNIYKFNPNARIIVMLRNPIELVQSMHAQLLWTLDEDVKDFETAWRLQEQRKQGIRIPKNCREPAFIQYGNLFLLGKQIERLMGVFPAEQIKIILYDDFKKDTVKIYKEVCEFLSVPNHGREKFPQVNARKSHINSGLARFTQRPPEFLVKSLEKGKKILRIERLGVMKRLQGINAQKNVQKKLSQNFLCELYSFFEEDISLLEELANKNLTSWKKQ